ncbi:helix-turn-helix transcriptional regulator [Uliginosibacterium sediminicola]|uniref:Helix-turn-helix transcriptional regulator n=1 Tax=Uliginosibacterium sediminicola TaxID=2024550 RepID=A0ABU9YT82_9RHOO
MEELVRAISPGFGERLKEERERLGMSQTALAEVAGIKRMAQGQYESELRSPTVRYLSLVAAVGVDTQYLLFGMRGIQLTASQRGLEKKAFQLVEGYARQQPDGQLGAEGRYAMFELLRAYLSQHLDDEGQPQANLAELLAGLGSHSMV